MKFRKLFWMIAVAMMAFVLAACGNTGGDNADGGDNSNASGAVELSKTETVESPDFGGSISVSYPDGWFFQSDGGGLFITNNEDAIGTSGPEDLDDIPVGTVVVTVSVIPSEMAGLMVTTDDEVTPAALIDAFSAFMGGEDFPEFGDTEELTIDGNSAARVSGSNDKMTASIYAINKDGNYTVGLGATRPDEAAANADVIQAILASATFTASE